MDLASGKNAQRNVGQQGRAIQPRHGILCWGGRYAPKRQLPAQLHSQILERVQKLHIDL
jgi:hypothetical protein